MKRFSYIFILIVMTLAACSTEPSDNSVNTAIANTQSAKPTNTTKPTDTPKPTATNSPEPTATDTPVPTETPIPPTPTIEPYVVYPRCNCTEIVKYGDNFVARLRWGATTKAFAEEGSDVIRYTMKINGEEVKDVDSYRRPAVYEKDPFSDLELWWVYWDYPLGVLPEGSYVIEARVIVEENTTDGIEIIPKGYSYYMHINLNVASP